MTSIANAAAFADHAAGPSRIGFGCMALTGTYGFIAEERARATLHRALDLGIRLFDTAALYGGGANEILLGEVLGKRENVFVTTKFGLTEGRDGKLVRDSQPTAIRRSVEASLANLRRERIDLLLQHRPDPNTPDEVVAEVALDLVREGKIAAFGLSATSMDRIDTFGSRIRISAVQNELSLASFDGLLDPKIASGAGAMFMAYAPLARGILTGRSVTRSLASDDLRSKMTRFGPKFREADARMLDMVDALARQHNATRAAVALAWTLSSGSNVVALPGARSPTHVPELLKASSLTLTAREICQLCSRE